MKNNNLAMLKVACVTLRDLKANERRLKGAILKEAAYRVYAYKYPYIDKYAGLFSDAKTDAYGSDYDRNGMWGRFTNMLGRAANWVNRDWGQKAVADYANSSQFNNEQDRQAYLEQHNKGWFGGRADKDMETYANTERENDVMHGANGLEQANNINKRITENRELNKSQLQNSIDNANKHIKEIENKQYNTPGTLGGPGGTNPVTGAGADHKPTEYGSNTRYYGGQEYSGDRPRGRYGYRRSGYGGRPYGGYSRYSSGGYGGGGPRRSWE